MSGAAATTTADIEQRDALVGRLFEGILGTDEPWTERIYGLRANASEKSHAELDEATELDEGDVDELAAHHVRLRATLPQLTVLGGCCGTDHRHIDAIANAWQAAA